MFSRPPGICSFCLMLWLLDLSDNRRYSASLELASPPKKSVGYFFPAPSWFGWMAEFFCMIAYGHNILTAFMLSERLWTIARYFYFSNLSIKKTNTKQDIISGFIEIATLFLDWQKLFFLSICFVGFFLFGLFSYEEQCFVIVLTLLGGGWVQLLTLILSGTLTQRPCIWLSIHALKAVLPDSEESNPHQLWIPVCACYLKREK